MGKTFAELEKEYAKERAYAKDRREAEEKEREKREMAQAIRRMRMERKYGTVMRVSKKIGKAIAKGSVALADKTIPKKPKVKMKKSSKPQKQPSMFAPTQDWGF